MKKIALLGSTGSIGCNVLNVVRQFPGRFQIVGLAAGRNLTRLREQIEAFQPRLVSVAEPTDAETLQAMLPTDWNGTIVSGREGNEAVASLPEADTVVSAIVGSAGLTPTVTALREGKDVALANKESLVMAGELVMALAADNNCALLPIDSEHNAIFQALAAGNRQECSKILLTASGGPFYQDPVEDLWTVTPKQALAHPNWDMGPKISIDSATLMNKGLELIEARWLFNLPVEQIEILIHPQSVVHSMVEFIDGSVIAQLGIADMRIPIAYALSYPKRLHTDLPPLNLATAPDLQFIRPDFKKFPALRLAYQVAREGGILPAAMNAANEIAVSAFLDQRIRFPEITLAVAETVHRIENRPAVNLETILEADLAARMQAESIVEAFELATQQKKGKGSQDTESAAV